MWGRGRPEGARATGPRPASTRWFAAPASPTPRSPSSTRLSLLFLRLRRLRLRLRRLPGRPRARAHVDAIFRLPDLARARAGPAHSAPRGGGARDLGPPGGELCRRCCRFASPDLSKSAPLKTLCSEILAKSPSGPLFSPAKWVSLSPPVPSPALSRSPF